MVEMIVVHESLILGASLEKSLKLAWETQLN